MAGISDTVMRDSLEAERARAAGQPNFVCKVTNLFEGGSKMSVRKLAVLGALVVCFAAATASAQTTITVLNVADTHSHLDMTGPKDANLNGTLYGMAKAASVIGMTKMTEPNVLTLHGGDAFHGDLLFQQYFGVPELQMMQALGFDAMALGNHEFDLGPDTLAYILYTAYGTDTLPLLSANVDFSAVPELGLDTWIKPTMMKEVGGVQVGIFGMTVPTNPTTNNGAVQILGGDDPAVVVGIAYQTMMALRGAGAQVVICLSHLGALYDQAIAANVPGIDVILGAHDHYEWAQPLVIPNPYGGQTIVTAVGKHYEKIAKMHLTVDATGVSLADFTLIPLDATIPGAPEIQGVVDQLKLGVVQHYGDVYHTKVGYAPWDIKTTFDPRWTMRDTGMGNLITDALRLKTRTDIAITANGLISEGITKGWIVGADVFRPVSYGYDTATGLGLKLVTFKFTGAELIKGLETTLAYYGISEDFFLQVSGVQFKFDSSRDVGSRVLLSTVKINGRPLSLTKTYSCTVNEGIAMLIPLLGITVTDMVPLPDLEYNVLKDYIHRMYIPAYTSQGRIRDVAAGVGAEIAEIETTDATGEVAGGCSAAGSASSFSLALLALGFVVLRRRR
jgi:5'-nucleotidase / UDP-sugar diphosphatase